jgi:hypothetical protein
MITIFNNTSVGIYMFILFQKEAAPLYMININTSTYIKINIYYADITDEYLNSQ